jgi:F-type H+-transporting ATPase subunit b
MPQLDPATFASQVFWLVVSFAVLALILWRIALPRISSTLESRQQRIDTDIARAEEIASEAEGVLSAYEEELAKARASAQEELHKAAEEVIAETEARNNALTETLACRGDRECLGNGRGYCPSGG